MTPLIVGLMLCPAAEALDAANDILASLGYKTPRVGRVVIRGSVVTANRVILNRLAINPGDRLRFTQLEQGRLNLIRTGFFDTEAPPTVYAVPPDDGGASWDVDVRVNEAKTGNVMLTVKITSEPPTTPK